jgi:hypothetical protein
LFGSIFLAPRGHAANTLTDIEAIALADREFAQPTATLTLRDTRPLEQAKHYIEISRPLGTMPDLQLFALKWVYVGDAIGIYARNFPPGRYEYYIQQNYCSALTGDTMNYARIVQMPAGTSWLEQVYRERRPLVEERFIIRFSEVYADLSEQMSGVMESDPDGPLGKFIQRHIGGRSASAGWATSR